MSIEELVLFWTVVAVFAVFVVSAAVALIVAYIADEWEHDVRRFKAACRRAYRWVKENAPAWRDQVYAWRHRTFRRMWV